MALRMIPHARSAARNGLQAAGGVAASAHSTLSTITQASPATAAAVTVSKASDNPAPAIGEDNWVNISFELMSRMGLKPGDKILTMLLVNGVRSHQGFTWQVPSRHFLVDSSHTIALLHDGQFNTLLKKFHQGWKRSRDGTLFAVISSKKVRRMSTEDCLEWLEQLGQCTPVNRLPGPSASNHHLHSSLAPCEPNTKRQRPLASLSPLAEVKARQQTPPAAPLHMGPFLAHLPHGKKAVPTPPNTTAPMISSPSSPPMKSSPLKPRSCPVKGSSHMGSTQGPHLGMIAAKRLNIPRSKPKATVNTEPQPQVYDGTAQRSDPPLPNKGRPRTGSVNTAAGTALASSNCLSPAVVRSLDGTGRLFDAGHSEGFWIEIEPSGTLWKVYTSCRGALCVCISDCVTAAGARNVDSTVRSILRYGRAGEPWVARVWHAHHSSTGSGSTLCMARVGVAQELLQHYLNNARVTTQEKLPGMTSVLEELGKLAAEESSQEQVTKESEGSCIL